MKNLNKLLQEAEDDLASLGVEYGNVVDIYVNDRFKAKWGRCCKVGNQYTIEINPALVLDTTTDQAVMNTIMHELIHTCKGCMNHGINFKRMANLVSIYGYTITRCTSADEKGLTSYRNTPGYYKYNLTCEKCGYIFKYAKATRLITYIQKKDHRQFYYKCTCGGNKFKLTYI